MDTRELPKAKDSLEREIGLAVRDLLTSFQKETGLNVNAVHFSFEDITTITDQTPQLRLTSVNTSISL